MSDTFTLMLAGDVMTGRGIDQVMAQPVDPVLYEPVVRDARDYVRLAERASGPVQQPMPPQGPWGVALAAIGRRRPALRLANLETAITDGGQPWPAKRIHYRMHPAHVDCLTAARLDACALANNHVLDWGVHGLHQTLSTLAAAGIQAAGAGADEAAARAPAVLPLPGGGRLLLFSRAVADSGVPADWAATAVRPGVAVLAGLDEVAAQQLAGDVQAWRAAGDRVVVSLHWGANWVLQVPQDHRRFARRLVDLGAADVVHGHSSHHPLPVELYRGRLILYGCGDLINDYEGIGPQGPFDPRAVCLWFATLRRADGALQGLEIVPLSLKRLQLADADEAARRELLGLLGAGEPGAAPPLQEGADGTWRLQPA